MLREWALYGTGMLVLMVDGLGWWCMHTRPTPMYTLVQTTATLHTETTSSLAACYASW